MPKKLTGASCRRKGHQFERDMAIEFQKLGWKDAKRHLEVQKAEAYGVDLDHTNPFLVQCKKGKKYAPISRLEEVRKEPGKIPILITKADREPTIAVLYWEDLKQFIKPTK